MNRNTLHILTGGPTVSSTSFVAPALAGVAPVLAEGWMDEEQMITEGWAARRSGQRGDLGQGIPPFDWDMQRVELDFIWPLGAIGHGLVPMDGDVYPDGWISGTQTVELDLIRGGDDEIILADWAVGPQIINSTETMLSAFGAPGSSEIGTGCSWEKSYCGGDQGSDGGDGGTGPFVGGTDFMIAEYDIITSDGVGL